MWKLENLFENDRIRADVEINGDRAKITLKDDSYSLARIAHSRIDVRPSYYARIDVPTEKTNPDTEIKIYELYFDKDGKELVRQYVDDERLSLVPEGAVSLEIVVLARGFGGGTVTVGAPTFTEIEEYKPRLVKVLALDVNPKLPLGVKRTCEINLQAAIERIDEVCEKEKPDLVLLTEIFLTLGVELERPGIDYVTFDGPEIAKLRALAKKHHTYLSFSVHETDENGYYYNGAPLIDREGNVVATYRKTHPTMKELAAGIIPGDKIVTYDADFGKIGFAICWDLFFPEFVPLTAKGGAEIILNPTLGYHFDQNNMRAQDTGCYIVTAGSYGRVNVIMSPFKYEGVIADGTENGYAVAVLDLNRRHHVPRLSAPSAAERPNVMKYESNNELLKKYR